MNDWTSEFWAGRQVRVLGGNGFLGRHLVRQLVEQGATVRTLSLGGAPLEIFGVEEVTGDATDPDAVRRVLDGGMVVFVTAGPVGVGGAKARSMGAHTAVIRTALDALPPGARLVLTSSVVTLGATRGAVLTEGCTDGEDVGVEYVRAKRAAEDVALAATGRDVVVVNPGYLFGPDDPGPSVMGDLCLHYWRGHLPFAPPGGINAVDVRDVARGHLLAAERGATGRRYVLGGENVRTPVLFAALAEAAGLRRRFLPRLGPVLITQWMRTLAAGAEVHHRLTGREPFPSFEMVRMNTRCWFASSARAAAELGYRSRPLADSLADAFAWHAARTRVAPRGLNRLWLRPAA
ncbi:NAD-dependent epimerase/dehydratase family protein [Urbifossiella limnaea]|uniref:NAD dependent epimerase/dehydratase family protein n=1 Tax=Urbifossiella limnaea TaxID=2528023 RepID=A0A517XT01_9BACT|nr:NAD-dependent epimerase/dehydratase family protein [Urbifossiella limnaea]QDU20621.1 NAD dependent epimerase/dehydratase family protein [Urbifossiella limnaea]